ncbi:MAG: GntR family transcriptional regulator [Akkermansiaceae bacterium]
MSELKRKSLTEQLVQAISRDIAAGVWTKQLPGYRVLAQRYNVSRTTCEKALRSLVANKLISQAEPGKMRAILRGVAKKQHWAKQNLLIIIDSRHPPTPLDKEMLLQIEDHWKEEGGTVSYVESDLSRAQKPSYQLKNWVNKFNPNCLLFETIPKQWIKPTENMGLPCYATGGSVRQNNGILSGTGFAIVRCIDNLLNEALKLGHRRIQLVLARATREQDMRKSIQRVTEPTLSKDWGGEEIDFSIKIPDLCNPSDWYNWWETMLRIERPTLVLTDSVFQAICLHNICLSAGVQIPTDISMVVMEDAEFLEWLNPIPTRYRTPKNEAFRHFREWMSNGFPEGSHKFLGAELIAGQTLGPAPKRVFLNETK